MMSFRAACADSQTDTNSSDLLRQHQQRLLTFAAQAAATIGSSGNGFFSSLDRKTLIRDIAGWYEGCSQAMLDGNYSLLDRWIAERASAASQKELEDVLQLLRTCRNMAIEVEHWNEDVLSPVDDVINETLRRIAGEPSKVLPQDFDYRTVGARTEPAEPPAEAIGSEPDTEQAEERRSVRRVRLRLPVRVCGTEQFCDVEEVTHTRDVSQTGLNFSVARDFCAKAILKVQYPYWTDHASINPEYAAEIVRLDHLQDGSRSVAVRFLSPLAPKRR